MSNAFGGIDPITTMSQLSGGPGLDAPNPFPDIPDPPPGFDPETHPMFVGTEPEPKASPARAQQWVPHARVFVVDDKGNQDYEALLCKGANGEIVLGRKEIADIKGTAAYKVYQEWLEPTEKKTVSNIKKRKEEAGLA